MDLGLAFRRDLDAAAERQALAENGGADLLGGDAAGLGRIGADDRPALIGRIGPGRALARTNGADRDVERVRLRHDARTGQIVVLGREDEAIHLRPQAGQSDVRLHLSGIERLVVEVGIEAEQWFRPFLIDGHLDGEVAVAKQAAVVRSAFVIGGGRRFAFGFGGLVAAAAGGQRQGDGGQDAAERSRGSA